MPCAYADARRDDLLPTDCRVVRSSDWLYIYVYRTENLPKFPKNVRLWTLYPLISVGTSLNKPRKTMAMKLPFKNDINAHYSSDVSHNSNAAKVPTVKSPYFNQRLFNNRSFDWKNDSRNIGLEHQKAPLSQCEALFERAGVSFDLNSSFI